jgi:biotin carboxyl carrier protein
MSVEIKLNNRYARVEILKQDDNLLSVKVDDTIYNIDLMHTDDGTFSIIENNRSHDIELVPLDHPKKYLGYTLYKTFDVEIIDAETRYLLDRLGGQLETGSNTITAPMPGKVVKVLVNEGDTVTKGQTVIILSAMKMESEYKSAVDGTIAKINVKEGDTVEGNQILIEIE